MNYRFYDIIDLCRDVAEQCAPHVPSAPLENLTTELNSGDIDSSRAIPEALVILGLAMRVAQAWVHHPDGATNSGRALFDPEVWYELVMAIDAYDRVTDE